MNFIPHTLDRPIGSCYAVVSVTAPGLGAVHLACSQTGRGVPTKTGDTRLKVNRLPRYFRGRVVRVWSIHQRHGDSSADFGRFGWSESEYLLKFMISVLTLIYFGNLMSLRLRVSRDFPRLCVERKRCSARVSSARARRRKSWSRRFPAKSGDVDRKSEGMVESQYQGISNEPTNIKSPLTVRILWFFLGAGLLLSKVWWRRSLQIDKPIGFVGPRNQCPYFPESIYHQWLPGSRTWLSASSNA